MSGVNKSVRNAQRSWGDRKSLPAELTTLPAGLTVPPAVLAVLAAVLLLAGCSHPAAWIVVPQLQVAAGQAGPGAVTGYDTNHDGRIDYLQIHNAQGVKRRLLFDTQYNGRFDKCVDLDALPESETRYLLVMLDGVSYQLLDELWAAGHFRLYYPPGRVIPRFPTVTDTIFADIFETPRPDGYEAEYYDLQANKETGGSAAYLAGQGEPVWPQHVLYRENYYFDAILYGLPGWTSIRELDKSIGAAIKWYEQDPSSPDYRYAALYMVSTDGLGHKKGHDYVKQYLCRVDEALEQLQWRSQGRLRIVISADHGLSEGRMRRLDLAPALEKAGFRLTKSLKEPRDVYLPIFGLVSYVAVYTRSPVEVAEAATKVEGVDFACYPERGGFAVRSADGLARVEASGTRYRYLPSSGDPLHLQPIIARMRTDGRIDADGWADPQAWLDYTADHDYPDPLERIAMAFDGNVGNPAHLLLSLGESYYLGSGGFDAFADLRGTHGSMHQCSTTTFVLSSFFAPPPYQRTAEFRDHLKRQLGQPTLLPARPQTK